MKLTTEELKTIIKEELETVLSEEDDRCTRIAKRKYDKWPSAYASGAVVKCRDGKIWKDLKEDVTEEEEEELEKISKELAGASKMHKGQSDRIKDTLKKEGKKNCGCGQDPCITYGKIHEETVNEEELEEASKCTKVTKKASSTRKGKKWMKCVKSDSGGYKRIHWGQKGVRVTGKSGNTKRKKSFKARHNCSKAKSNTPQGQACKDWAEE